MPGSFSLNTIIIICSRLALASSSTQMTVSCYLLSCLISLPLPPPPGRICLPVYLSVSLSVLPLPFSLSLFLSLSASDFDFVTYLICCLFAPTHSASHTCLHMFNTREGWGEKGRVSLAPSAPPPPPPCPFCCSFSASLLMFANDLPACLSNCLPCSQ